MSGNGRTLRLGVACVLLGALFALSGTVECAFAENLEQQIIDALKPKVKTRGLTSSRDSARDVEQMRFIESLPKTRSLTLQEREQVAAVAKEKASIDLEVYFDYNSANVRADAMDRVSSLGRALTSSELKGSTFFIAGHTDAKGSENYNQGLSERRAESMKRVLIETYGVPAENLVTAGYGKEKLKNPGDPFGGENRRVQIVNLETKKTAGQ